MEPNEPNEPTHEPNEHDWEQANRLAKWMRLAIVPLVLVLAAILLVGRGDAVAGKPVKTKYGATSQGREFQLRLDDKGRPASFSTELVARCPTGRLVNMPWDSVDGDGVRFGATATACGSPSAASCGGSRSTPAARAACCAGRSRWWSTCVPRRASRSTASRRASRSPCATDAQR